jgi:hypothetical protein
MSRKVGECPAARGYCKGNQYNGGSVIYLLIVPVWLLGTVVMSEVAGGASLRTHSYMDPF